MPRRLTNQPAPQRVLGRRANSVRDIEALAIVIHQIELILADHIEPGHTSDPEGIIDRIFVVS
jgi:hypothetical protein